MKDNPDEQWSIESDGNGCHFMIKVTAGAKRNHAGGNYQGALKISVTQIAEKGKANKEVLKLLTKAIRVKKSQLLLRSGETARLKKFYCSQISAEELRKKLNQLR